MDEETPKAELTVKKANTSSGNVGWDIRLQRKDVQDTEVLAKAQSEGINYPLLWRPETDEEYFQRTVAMFDRCEKQWGKKQEENLAS